MSDVLTLGCTYFLDIELDDHSIDLTLADFIYVTLKQGTTLKTISSASSRLQLQNNGYEIMLYLDQADALAFSPGAVQLQVNWLENDLAGGYFRRSSDIASFVFDKQLLRRTLPLASEVK